MTIFIRQAPIIIIPRVYKGLMRVEKEGLDMG